MCTLLNTSVMLSCLWLVVSVGCRENHRSSSQNSLSHRPQTTSSQTTENHDSYSALWHKTAIGEQQKPHIPDTLGEKIKESQEENPKPCEMQEGGCAKRYGCFLDLPAKSIAIQFINPAKSHHVRLASTNHEPTDMAFQIHHIAIQLHKKHSFTEIPLEEHLEDLLHVTIDQQILINDIETIKLQLGLSHHPSPTSTLTPNNPTIQTLHSYLLTQEQTDIYTASGSPHQETDLLEQREINRYFPEPLFDAVALLVNQREIYRLPWKSFEASFTKETLEMLSQKDTTTQLFIRMVPKLFSDNEEQTLEGFYAIRQAYEKSCNREEEYLKTLMEPEQDIKHSSKNHESPKEQDHKQDSVPDDVSP